MLIRTTAAAWALALPAFAQQAGHTSQAAPSSLPTASAPAGEAPNTVRVGASNHYLSVFKGYRPYADEPMQDWKAANDRVAQIGGWRAYATEAAGGQDSAAVHAGHGAAPAPAAQKPTHAGTPATQTPAGHEGAKPHAPPAAKTLASPALPASAPAAKPQGGHSQHH